MYFSQTLFFHFELIKYFRHGRLVARYPFRYILACLIIAIGCGAGLYFLHWETNIVRLWNPENSESGSNFKWLWRNHPPDLRRHSILFQAENILNKENLKKVFVIINIEDLQEGGMLTPQFM